MPKITKVVLFLESSRQYGRDLISGIAQYSLLHGPWTFYKEDTFYCRQHSKINDFSWIKRWGADGIITRDFQEIHKLKDLGLPIIAVEAFQEAISDIVEIVSDHKQIGVLACDYFMSHGFHNFAYCGFQDMPWSMRRAESFADAIGKKEYKVDIFNSKSQRLTNWDKEYPILIDWLKSLPKPVAILCCNDDRGNDIIEACKTAGLKVPYEVAVLGVDNDQQVCDLTNPPLSSITLSTQKAGYLAAEALDRLISGQKVQTANIQVKVLGVHSRQSTDSMAIDDRQVAQALHYINQNDKKLIQVSDVLEAVGCSRKGLDQKFQRCLGHSVFAEIRRMRIQNICNMLSNTNISISEIALKLGYNDADHIARFFKQEKDITPMEYRKKFSI
ncbi:MAG: DNA-binding transcriptional regulator [Phycisphaerae bacterium]|nr:DNA-binding transcriptional regulator [Phycisphaerae bacterium]